MAGPSAPATHANGSAQIDHVVLLTPDLARTSAALETIGVTPRGERDSDTYGAPMRQIFFRLERWHVHHGIPPAVAPQHTARRRA